MPHAQQPRSATYSATTIFAASFGLVALFGVLAALALVVRDANAHAVTDRVVPGKISVVGAAKVRTWESDGFSVRLPATWGLVATGPVRITNAGDYATANRRPRQIALHRWQGNLEPGAADGNCQPGVACTDISIERPADASQREVRQYAEARLRDAEAADGKKLHFVDLGPVTARGGRWVWRWVSTIGDEQRTSYFFATCAHAKVDHFWQVSLRAPSGTNVQEQFADLVASLKTDLPNPASGDKDCSGVLDR